MAIDPQEYKLHWQRSLTNNNKKGGASRENVHETNQYTIENVYAPVLQYVVLPLILDCQKIFHYLDTCLHSYMV